MRIQASYGVNLDLHHKSDAIWEIFSAVCCLELELIKNMKKNILILSRNYNDYVSGPYYQELIDAFLAKHNVFLYGPGYDNYCQEDNLEDVLAKSTDILSSVDLIVVSNSWGDENPANPIFDVHPNICLS